MSVKKIAIYLPQFHPIPENDKAWGEGFTEWTNVKKAKPLFEDHYQPHVPHESVGYYSLSDPQTLKKQAALAQANGIYGFAYYHYWFNGKRLLHEPLDNMLQDGEPAMPFCYIWANENWTKRWDGADQEVIMEQEYSEEDDYAHITFLCKNVFSDNRYICIDGKPVFLIYRTELIPDIKRTARLWKKVVKEFGFEGIYLVRVDNFVKDIAPGDIDFDAVMEFAPDWSCVDENPVQVDNKKLFDYRKTVYNMLLKEPACKYFNCVFPGWDNTPRRRALSGSVFVNNDAGIFKYFIETQLANTVNRFPNIQERFIFINAWNEWGEGCHIEPDTKNGFTYLEICKNATPRQTDDFETYLAAEVNVLRSENKSLDDAFQILNRKYSHMINGRYYKAGKAIQAVLNGTIRLLRGR